MSYATASLEIEDYHTHKFIQPAEKHVFQTWTMKYVNL